MSKKKTSPKTYPKCEECKIFQKTKQLPARALICETARAIGDCPKDKFVEGLVTELKKLEDTYIKLITTCVDSVKEIKNLELPEMLDKAEEYLQLISKLNARLSEIKQVLVLLGVKGTKQ